MGHNLIFLDANDQGKIGSEFVDQLPWHSFGRKNVGFLYAIACGAKVVWDFDDNNLLKFWLREAAPDPTLEIWTYSHTSDGKNEVFYLCWQTKDQRNIGVVVSAARCRF